MQVQLHPEHPIDVNWVETAEGLPISKPMRLPAGVIGAAQALICARTDARHIPALERYSRSVDENPKLRGRLQTPHRLTAAALYACMLADCCHDARWEGSKPYRLRDDMLFPDAGQDSPDRRWVRGTLLTLLFDACAAAAWRASDGTVRGPAECRSSRDLLDAFAALVYRYPNVSPEAESRLAANGHTVAEYLVVLATYVIDDIAKSYRLWAEVGAPDFGQLAARASEDAAEARRIIAYGVAHTLDGRAVALDVVGQES